MKKQICDPDMRETVKALAQLDGALVVSGDGVVISAARHINASSRRIELPRGLGSRHVAAASISRDTRQRPRLFQKAPWCVFLTRVN